MSTSKKIENESDAYNITVITIITDDELSEKEKGIIYRNLWGWLESQCIKPKGIQIE